MSDEDPDPPLHEGAVAPRVAREHPELRLRWVDATLHRGRTPAGLAERLGVLSDRLAGARAVRLRTESVPAAYRAFLRTVGLDPDVTRTPAEEAVLERLRHGGFATGRWLADAVTLAVAETGVGLWALAPATLQGPLTVREARDGERLGAGEAAHELAAGRLVLADDARPVAELFGRLGDAHVPRGPGPVRLVCVQVAGVPDLAVEEALWLGAEALAPERARR